MSLASADDRELMAKAGLGLTPLSFQLQFFDATLPRPPLNEKLTRRYAIEILHFFLFWLSQA